MRHTCATLLVAEDVQPKVVQEILGHSQISLTMDTYSRVLPHVGREAAQQMHSLLAWEWLSDWLSGRGDEAHRT